MSAISIEHLYRYQQPSEFLPGPVPRLRLAMTDPAEGGDDSPHFFVGRLVHPRRTAEMLRALMSVVQARFHLPPNMLARVLALSDPVVTSTEGRLRFEGFSACCGLYARVDLLPAAEADAR